MNNLIIWVKTHKNVCTLGSFDFISETSLKNKINVIHKDV